MDESSWARWGAASGLLFVATVLAYVFVTPKAPHFDASPTRVAAYYLAHRSALTTSGVLVVFSAGVVFVWFLAHLRSVLRRAEGGDDTLAPIVFGAGITLAAVSVVSVVPNQVLAFRAARAGDAGVISAFYEMNHLFGGFRAITLGLFVLAASLAMIRGELVAPWLGWAGLAVVAVNWVSGVQRFYGRGYGSGWATLTLVALLVFTAWILATSIAMLAGPKARRIVARS
ncbi:MAG TPA: hypothetical protein VG869_10450 [Acidimicrobiia bacterium]|jgi:hypothetical protein|nr:hypothetical protein [Acidimicrobiia bacterium]